MLIRSRTGISADGFVSSPGGGVPALAVAPGFGPDGDVHLVLRPDHAFPDGPAGLVGTPA
jgi:hypothetical protein